jgi:sugar-phosphatase
MRIRAVLFDMDGTLVDSESQTDDAVREAMTQRGHAGVLLPPSETRGRSWRDVASTLRTRFSLADSISTLEEELAARWIAMIDTMIPIPGAAEALAVASPLLSLGVVSSSPHALIDRILDRAGLARWIPPDSRFGVDDVERPKPDPSGFMLAARRLGVRPDECVVFEDSRAGLLAARAAGMVSVVVLCRSAEPELCRTLATGACLDYNALPPSFWSDLVTIGPSVLGREG